MSAIGRVRWAGRALVGIIAVVMVIDAFTVVRNCQLLRPIRPGDVAPDFRLPRIGRHGRLGPAAVSLSSFRGKVTVVDFWATWCGPCRESMPSVEKIVASQGGADVALLSVCVDGHERAAQARRIADQLAPNATLVADSGTAANLYGVSTIPQVMVIDPQGHVVWMVRGFPGSDALEDGLTRALKSARGR